jgi:peptide-methionine (R)-S-oxide reductase
MTDKPIPKDEAGWRKNLTPEQYRVLREKGTEPPFNNELHDNKQSGTYVCAACGLNLYSSDHKFDSGTGWPSYFQAIADGHVKQRCGPLS